MDKRSKLEDLEEWTNRHSMREYSLRDITRVLKSVSKIKLDHILVVVVIFIGVSTYLFFSSPGKIVVDNSAKVIGLSNKYREFLYPWDPCAAARQPRSAVVCALQL